MKKLLLVGIVIVAVLVAALLLIPPFINLGAYKDRFLPLVEENLQRKVDLGEARLRFLPSPSVYLKGLTVSDHPSFSKEPFLTVGEFRLELRLLPLLRGQLRVAEFVLEKPTIKLIKKADGSFNFSTIGKGNRAARKAPARQEQRAKQKGKAKEEKPAGMALLIPSRVRVRDGSVTWQAHGQKPLQIQGIELSLESAGRTFPYRVAWRLPGLKPIVLEGNINADESMSTLNLKENRLRLQDQELAINGSVTEIKTTPRMNLTINNDRLETKPIIELLSQAGLTPKELNVAGPLGLKVALRGPAGALSAQSRTSLKGIKVNHKGIFDGTVTGESSLQLLLGGPAPVTQTLRGQGKVVVKDGKLTNVDLISKIQQLTGLIGLPQEESRGATSFETLENDFTLGGGAARFQRIYLKSPLMEAKGDGTMTLASPTLDLRLQAALSPQLSARVRGGNATAFFKDSEGRVVIPLRIAGPANNPSVALDSREVIKKGAGQFLERFFRRR